MSDIKVPGNVSKQLGSDEEVIAKFSYGNKDLYATNKRILAFDKAFIYFLLFGLLGELLASKSFKGSIEYSEISGVQYLGLNLNSMRILGLIILLAGIGIITFFLVFTMNLDALGFSVFGFVLGIPAIIVGLIFMIKKSYFWQIEVNNEQNMSPEIWRIPSANKDSKAKGFMKLYKESKEFVEAINERIKK